MTLCIAVVTNNFILHCKLISLRQRSVVIAVSNSNVMQHNSGQHYISRSFWTYYMKRLHETLKSILKYAYGTLYFNTGLLVCFVEITFPISVSLQERGHKIPSQGISRIPKNQSKLTCDKQVKHVFMVLENTCQAWSQKDEIYENEDSSSGCHEN